MSLPSFDPVVAVLLIPIGSAALLAVLPRLPLQAAERAQLEALCGAGIHEAARLKAL